jgi:hypothetical protein
MLNEEESGMERLMLATAQAIDGKMKHALSCCCMGNIAFGLKVCYAAAILPSWDLQIKYQLDMHVLEKLMSV